VSRAIDPTPIRPTLPEVTGDAPCPLLVDATEVGLLRRSADDDRPGERHRPPGDGDEHGEQNS
jgi:hypothetical protein